MSCFCTQCRRGYWTLGVGCFAMKKHFLGVKKYENLHRIPLNNNNYHSYTGKYHTLSRL